MIKLNKTFYLFAK